MPIRCMLMWYSNATNRERLLTREYAYHSLEDQQDHWENANRAYTELEQVQADHARHTENIYRTFVLQLYWLRLWIASFRFHVRYWKRHRNPYDHDTVDCYNKSPVYHTTPHSRSRSNGLPSPGNYCDRLTASTEERMIVGLAKITAGEGKKRRPLMSIMFAWSRRAAEDVYSFRHTNAVQNTV